MSGLTYGLECKVYARSGVLLYPERYIIYIYVYILHGPESSACMQAACILVCTKPVKLNATG